MIGITFNKSENGIRLETIFSTNHEFYTLILIQIAVVLFLSLLYSICRFMKVNNKLKLIAIQLGQTLPTIVFLRMLICEYTR